MNKVITLFFMIGCVVAVAQAQTQEEIIIDNDCSVFADSLARCQPYGCSTYDNELQDVRITYAIIGKNQEEKTLGALRCHLAAWYELKNIVVHTDGAYDEVGIRVITKRLQNLKDEREIDSEKLHEEITRMEEAIGSKANKGQKIPGEALDIFMHSTKVENINNINIYDAITQKLSAAISDSNPYWNEGSIFFLAKQAAKNSLKDFLDNLKSCTSYRFMYKSAESHVIHKKDDDKCYYDYIARDSLVNCALLEQDLGTIKNFFKQNFRQENEYLELGINNESPDRAVSEKTSMQMANKDDFKDLLLGTGNCTVSAPQDTSPIVAEPYTSSSALFEGPIITSQATMDKIKQALSNFVKHNGRRQIELELAKKEDQIQRIEFILGAVVYLSKDAWAFWINNKKITSRDSRKVNDKLQVTDITYNSVSFSIPYNGSASQVSELSKLSTKTIQDNVVMDSDMVKFTLYTNQKFSLNTMSISEVQPGKEEEDVGVDAAVEDILENAEDNIDLGQDIYSKKATEEDEVESGIIYDPLSKEVGSFVGRGY